MILIVRLERHRPKDRAVTISDRQIAVPPMPDTVLAVGSSAQVGTIVAGLGASKAFLVADRGVAAAGLVEPIEHHLRAAGIDVRVFDEVDPNPTDRNVDAGLTALRQFGSCVVVLLGGGSAMDCGKYLAMAAPNEGTGVEFAFAPSLGADDTIDFSTLLPARLAEIPPYPTVAIPTTAGTASETNGGGLITDTSTDRKLTFNHDGVKPRSVLLDPALTVGLPPVPTATCGMDVLTHAIEALTSTNNNPLSDGLALQAIRMVSEWLPRVVDAPDDLEGRSQMLFAAHLAGRAFSSGPLLGLVHAMGHPISAVLHQPHGQTLATMLPHVMQFNRAHVAERYGWVSQAMGGSANPDAAIDAVRSLSSSVGTNRTLSDLGATPTDLPVLVEQALSDLIILTTPRYPSRAEVTEIYKVALAE